MGPRLRAQRILGTDQDLTGDLVVERRTGILDTQWTAIATIDPQPPGSVTSQRDPTYATERGTIRWSLNFIVRAAL